jgi:hypothetical protein
VKKGRYRVERREEQFWREKTYLFDCPYQCLIHEDFLYARHIERDLIVRPKVGQLMSMAWKLGWNELVKEMSKVEEESFSRM